MGAASNIDDVPLADRVQISSDELKQNSGIRDKAGRRNDIHIVDWDGPDDPANPVNFTPLRKWTILMVIGSSCFAVTCASSMVASNYPQMEVDFNISRVVATLGITLFVLGLGIGPLVLAPLSEFYGRNPIFLIGYFVYAALQFLSAFGNLPGFMIGRFLQGLAGSAFLSVTGGSVTDMWVGQQVSRPMAIYSAQPFMGPIFGPVIAGFISLHTSWRWTWYVCTIWSWAQFFLLLIFVPETYARRLLTVKAARLRKATGDISYKSQAELDLGETNKARYVLESIPRPFQLLMHETMVFLLCLWCSLLLGILYCFFSSFPIVFRSKGFTEAEVSLSYLGVGLGIAIATALNATYFANLYAKTAKRLGHKPPPEEHLKKAMWAAVLGPASLFWFAWTSQPSVSWIATEFSTVFYGMAFTFAVTASFTYKVGEYGTNSCTEAASLTASTADAYRPYAASAMGANSFLRSSFAAAFPLFTTAMYDKLGVTWAGTLLACLLLVLTPAPFLFFKYGARLRARSRFTGAIQ